MPDVLIQISEWCRGCVASHRPIDIAIFENPTGIGLPRAGPLEASETASLALFEQAGCRGPVLIRCRVWLP